MRLSEILNVLNREVENPSKPKSRREAYLNLQKELDDHLKLFGHTTRSLVPRIRDFYKETREDHYDRIIYRDAVAQLKGMDMTQDTERTKLWDIIGKDRGIGRTRRELWESGEFDPPPDLAWDYLLKHTPGIA